jgi:tRNA (guanine-N7-)-methyltransferase
MAGPFVPGWRAPPPCARIGYTRSMPPPSLRKVRSFVRRPGRATTAQRRALSELGPRYTLAFAKHELDWREVFGREAPRVLDIGFGDGEALLSAAANQPDVDFLGVEVHEPGVGHLLLLIERARAENVRIVVCDVVEVLDRMLPGHSFDAVNLFFPDPWPKKRHHKRRLVQPEFVDRVARVLRSDGLFHIATDWDDYAAHIAEVMTGREDFVRLAEPPRDPLTLRAPSKFERRGQALGHEVLDLYYRKTGNCDPSENPSCEHDA